MGIFEQRREVLNQQQAERNANADRIKWERDSETRIEEAKEAGFIIGAKVRRYLKPDTAGACGRRHLL